MSSGPAYNKPKSARPPIPPVPVCAGTAFVIAGQPSKGDAPTNPSASRKRSPCTLPSPAKPSPPTSFPPSPNSSRTTTQRAPESLFTIWTGIPPLPFSFMNKTHTVTHGHTRSHTVTHGHTRSHTVTHGHTRSSKNRDPIKLFMGLIPLCGINSRNGISAWERINLGPEHSRVGDGIS